MERVQSRKRKATDDGTKDQPVSNGDPSDSVGRTSPQGSSTGVVTVEVEQPSPEPQLSPAEASPDVKHGSRLNQRHLKEVILRQVPEGERAGLEEFMSLPPRRSAFGRVPGPCPVRDLFEAFSKEEVGISGRKAEDLVRPSGNLASPLAIRLHYPTYNVKEARYGQTLDDSSSCIRVLMRKGLSEQVFWYESYFRREASQTDASGARLVPTDSYTEDLLNCHERFCGDCEGLAGFRVVLLAGVRAGEGFKKRYHPRSIKVSTLGCWLHLVENEAKITMIGVSLPHPEAFLRALSGKVRYPYRVAEEADVAINVAVTLTNVDLDVPESYFLDFLKNRYFGPETVTDFDESPMTALMSCRKQEIDSGNFLEYGKIPLTIKRYAAKEMRLESAEMVEEFLRPQNPGETYIMNAYKIMFTKSYESRKNKADEKRASSAVGFEKTIMMMDNMVVQTVCEGCGTYRVRDTSPMFGTMKPVAGLYITRSTERCPNGCSTPNPGKKSALRLDLIPVDPSVQYIGQKKFRKLVVAERARLKKYGC